MELQFVNKGLVFTIKVYILNQKNLKEELAGKVVRACQFVGWRILYWNIS
jgi:hypothetical protein